MMKRKFTLFLTFLCLITLSVVSLPVSLATAKTTPKQESVCYVAFGDSIAAGYGLEGYDSQPTDAPADSYQAQLGAFLKTQPKNYAVTGDDSQACIDLLTSGAADASLASADVISLSIGSNDLLLPFIQILMDYFDIEPDSIDASLFTDGFSQLQIDLTKLSKYLEQSKELMKELSDQAQLHAQAAAFKGQFQKLLKLLRQKAPKAEIYVTNIYNPFVSIPKLRDLADIYISEINQAFSADAAAYTLIDVYTPFMQNAAYTNIRFDISNPVKPQINPDPHPSVKGHKAMADLFIQALSSAHAPKAAALRVSTSRSYKLTANIKLPANADGCQLRYATSKNGSYKILSTTSKKKLQTNAKKLKAGNTYYFKACSYVIDKGVTYYGKESSAQKLTIK